MEARVLRDSVWQSVQGRGRQGEAEVRQRKQVEMGEPAGGQQTRPSQG